MTINNAINNNNNNNNNNNDHDNSLISLIWIMHASLYTTQSGLD